MRIVVTLFALFFLTCVAGNANANPIDTLVSELSNDPLWENGISPKIDLPKTASVKSVVDRCLKLSAQNAGQIQQYNILKTQQVTIPNSSDSKLPKRDYIGILISSKLGKKIVLIAYQNGWWTRVFDVNPFYSSQPRRGADQN